VVVNDVGADLTGAGTDPDIAGTVVSEIKRRGGEAVAVSESVAIRAGGRRIIEAALDAFGDVHILINNAGILKDRSFVNMSESEWDDVVAIHLKGAFQVTQPAVLEMKRRNFGRVVFTASTSGLFGNFGQTNYGSAKMGLVGLMNSLRLEVAKYDIKINTIAPTAATRMTDAMFTGALKERMAIEYNVPLVLYLVSDQNQESGMIFCAKGGWYARTAIVCGKGVAFDPANGPPTPEAIQEHFDAITDLQGAEPLESGADTMRFLK
jgi:NAD(P)-dependent dehydrogenase (short-subunit alcohol dehydrogenase family)